VLPAAYAAERLDLGYAITGHGAQGVTVETAHVIATSRTTRENLYVALTRGRESNHVYVVTDTEQTDADTLRPERATAAEVLTQALRTSGAEASAHQAQQAEEEHWNSIAQWAAEYRTIAAAARPARERALATARGMAAHPSPRLIVGLIPEPAWPVPADLQFGLADLEDRIEQRARDRLAEAIRSGAPWLASFGPVPSEECKRNRWRAAALTVAAYRDMHGIDSDQPLGKVPADPAQRVDRARARQAIAALRRQSPRTPIQVAAPAPSDRAPVLGL
jgi:hypothetical protein